MCSFHKFLIIGTLFLTLVSFYSGREETSINSETFYGSRLAVGDSLSIASKFSNCFNEESFHLKILKKSDHLEVSLSRNNVKTVVAKQMSEETIKEIIAFEATLLPNHYYGIGSSCMIIFTYNNHKSDTLYRCPDETQYQSLIEKISN